MNKGAEMVGFTLIEVLVALVIVSVAVLSLGSFTISTMSTGQVSRERISAVHLAEQVVEFWQHDLKDFVPAVSSSCGLTKGTSAANPLHVVCTPTSGVGISYTIDAVSTQLSGPMAANLSIFKNFTKQGYSNTPYTKLVTVSWSNKGKSHSVYLKHLSMVK